MRVGREANQAARAIVKIVEAEKGALSLEIAMKIIVAVQTAINNEVTRALASPVRVDAKYLQQIAETNREVV